MRLTTDTPESNLEMALNLFYVKDKQTWVRGYGENGADISLTDLTQELMEQYTEPVVPPKEKNRMSKRQAERLLMLEMERRLIPAPLREQFRIYREIWERGH